MTTKDVTTLLDLVGLLVIVAGVAVAVWPYFPPASFVAGGLGLLLISWLIDRKGGKA